MPTTTNVRLLGSFEVLADPESTTLRHVGFTVEAWSEARDDYLLVGHASTYLLDPWAPGDVRDEADSLSGDLAALVEAAVGGGSFGLLEDVPTGEDVVAFEAVLLDTLHVDEERRGEGIGTVALALLVQHFTGNASSLLLRPQPLGWEEMTEDVLAVESTRLRRFYARAGFVEWGDGTNMAHPL